MTEGEARERKVCVGCGRSFAWRKRWQRCWDRVRYCSERCRRQRADQRERALERLLLELCRARPDGSVCPSEVARRTAPDDRWRQWMEPVRRAARRLAHAGDVEITQHGQVVDPSAFRGPIRVRLTRSPR